MDARSRGSDVRAPRRESRPTTGLTVTTREIALGPWALRGARQCAFAARSSCGAISPRTADELAGFFRDASYTLTEVRQGEAVPPLKVDRVPGDLDTKDGNERKSLFITAILPVVLEVNQRVLADREQLLYLRDKIADDPTA